MASVKASVLEAPGQLVLREFPRPVTAHDDALLRVELAGVCSTDVKMFEGLLAERSNYPLILGHEVVGIIEEIGERAAQRWGVKAGDRVAVDSFIGCGVCAWCLSGNSRFCTQGMSYGTRLSTRQAPSLWGGYAEYMYLAPNAQVYRLPFAVSPALGVLVCAVLANGIRWVVAVGGATIGTSVVVQGPGAQGLAAVVAAKESGAYPIIITGLSQDESRLELARKLGADQILLADKDDVTTAVKDITCGRLADLVVDVTGSPTAMSQAVELVRPKGKVVWGGLTGNKPAHIPVDKAVFREIDLQGVFSHDSHSVRSAINLLSLNKYPLENLVTHYFSLEAACSALEVAGGKRDSNVVKVVVNPFS